MFWYEHLVLKRPEGKKGYHLSPGQEAEAKGISYMRELTSPSLFVPDKRTTKPCLCALRDCILGNRVRPRRWNRHPNWPPRPEVLR